MKLPAKFIAYPLASKLTPVGIVTAAAEVQLPPAVIVSPDVQVMAPEVGLLTIQVPMFLPARLIVWAAVPVSWLGLVELLVKATVPVDWVTVTLFWKMSVGLLTPEMVKVPAYIISNLNGDVNTYVPACQVNVLVPDSNIINRVVGA